MIHNKLVNKRMLTVITLLAASQTPAAVVDFQSLTEAGDSAAVFATYDEDGFNFRSALDPILAGDAFGVWQTGSSNFNGSTALFNTYVDGSSLEGPVTIMTRPDGIPFDVSSIDIGPMFADPGFSGSVTFVGERAGGGSVTQTFTYGTALTPQTFAFNASFNTLRSLTWDQVSPFWQVDNINAAAIPEPSSVVLLVVGAGGLLVIARRRQRRR